MLRKGNLNRLGQEGDLVGIQRKVAKGGVDANYQTKVWLVYALIVRMEAQR